MKKIQGKEGKGVKAKLDIEDAKLDDGKINHVRLENSLGLDYDEVPLMPFTSAFPKLRQGYSLTRSGWGGRFITMQIPSEIPLSTVPKMQSLNKWVKDIFSRRAEINEGKKEFDTIRYTHQVVMIYPDNWIIGWSPTLYDLFSDNWIVI